MRGRQHWIMALLATTVSTVAQESPLVHYVFHAVGTQSLPTFARSNTSDQSFMAKLGSGEQSTPDESKSSEELASGSQSCSPAALNTDDVKILVEKVAREEGFDAKMAVAVARQESRFNVRARSPKGAMGVMQLMPDTAKSLGVDPCNVEQNIRGGVRYLKDLEAQFKNPIYYLAAYNSGPKRVRDNGGVPPIHETVNYVAAILNDYHGWQEIRPVARSAGGKPRGYGSTVVARADATGWKSGFVMNFDE